MCRFFSIRLGVLIATSIIISCAKKHSRDYDDIHSAPQKSSPPSHTDKAKTAHATENSESKAPDLSREIMQIFPSGDGDGIIALSPDLMNAANSNAASLNLTDAGIFSSINNEVLSDPAVISAAAATIVAGGVVGGSGTAAVVNRKKLREKFDRLLVFQGLTKDKQKKIGVFQRAHAQNLYKSAANPHSRFSEISLANSNKGKIILGILPDEATLKAVKQEGTDEKLSVLSIVEKFELQGFKNIEYKGNKYSLEPFNKEQINGEWKHLESPDYQGVKSNILDEGADFINTEVSKGSTVYVHCKSGKGRSASLVAAYLMKYQGQSLDQAVAHIKSQRPEVSIGKSLFGEHYKFLQKYEKFLSN